MLAAKFGMGMIANDGAETGCRAADGNVDKIEEA